MSTQCCWGAWGNNPLFLNHWVIAAHIKSFMWSSHGSFHSFCLAALLLTSTSCQVTFWSANEQKKKKKGFRDNWLRHNLLSQYMVQCGKSVAACRKGSVRCDWAVPAWTELRRLSFQQPLSQPLCWAAADSGGCLRWGGKQNMFALKSALKEGIKCTPGTGNSLS